MAAKGRQDMTASTGLVKHEMLHCAVEELKELCWRIKGDMEASGRTTEDLVDAIEELDMQVARVPDMIMTIAVCGEGNCGKSTFLNALLGGWYAPTAAIPATSALTRYMVGQDPRSFVMQAYPTGAKADKENVVTKVWKAESFEPYGTGRTLDAALAEFVTFPADDGAEDEAGSATGDEKPAPRARSAGKAKKKKDKDPRKKDPKKESDGGSGGGWLAKGVEVAKGVGEVAKKGVGELVKLFDAQPFCAVRFEEVDVQIPSNHFLRDDLAIVDVPGLNQRLDNSRTCSQVMKKCHMIVYLINATSTLTANDQMAIRMLGKVSEPGHLFFFVNKLNLVSHPPFREVIDGRDIYAEVEEEAKNLVFDADDDDEEDEDDKREAWMSKERDRRIRDQVLEKIREQLLDLDVFGYDAEAQKLYEERLKDKKFGSVVSFDPRVAFGKTDSLRQKKDTNYGQYDVDKDKPSIVKLRSTLRKSSRINARQVLLTPLRTSCRRLDEIAMKHLQNRICALSSTAEENEEVARVWMQAVYRLEECLEEDGEFDNVQRQSMKSFIAIIDQHFAELFDRMLDAMKKAIKSADRSAIPGYWSDTRANRNKFGARILADLEEAGSRVVARDHSTAHAAQLVGKMIESIIMDERVQVPLSGVERSLNLVANGDTTVDNISNGLVEQLVSDTKHDLSSKLADMPDPFETRGHFHKVLRAIGWDGAVATFVSADQMVQIMRETAVKQVNDLPWEKLRSDMVSQCEHVMAGVVNEVRDMLKRRAKMLAKQAALRKTFQKGTVKELEQVGEMQELYTALFTAVRECTE